MPLDLLPFPLDLTPCEVAARCAHFPGLVFFDTALEQAGSAQVEKSKGPKSASGVPLSIIAIEPSEIFAGCTEADWAALREAVAERQVSASPSPGDGQIPRGFAAGWVEYNGAFRFGFYDQLLVYRHERQGASPPGEGEERGGWFSVGGLHRKLARELLETPPRVPFSASIPSAPLDFKSGMQREEFIQKVEQAQDYIASGDIYQVNLAHRFSTPWHPAEDEKRAAFAFYSALRQSSPAPHAAFLSLGERTVLSSSPELFLKIGGRHVFTRPIKGTRPRHREPHADEKSACELVTSPKEIAELVMITDLLRNDLGRVCEYGSVAVREMLKLERYEQVFHLVSTVEGRLRPELDAVAALRACFPGGSITGAPKKRAMEIIAELEPEPRGLYTGAIGYFGFNGESQFSIAIRTLVLEQGEAHFHVGAGIVADSKPEKEWQETLDKAAGILLAARQMQGGGID